jgi:hypothetical protein
VRRSISSVRGIVLELMDCLPALQSWLMSE